MKGLFRRLGCLILIIVLLLAAWYWYARVDAKPSSTATNAAAIDIAKGSNNSGWQSFTPSDADRGRAALQAFNRPSGPVFVNLTPAEAGSYLLASLNRDLPPSATNAQAAVIGNRLYVRSEVAWKDFGDSRSLNSIRMLLGERDSVLVGGTIKMLHPGLAELNVEEMKLGKFDVPAGLRTKLVGEIKKRNPVAGVSQDALPVVLPSYITDVRIENGKITLYKSVR
ncbi:MAG TPA: hypothetical protein VFP26_12115 [Gemmatimonadaceae bacterium]|jgi:hypothetical protein|nr:hypothetical protein [Gemmatimonadaceae bacterium]